MIFKRLASSKAATVLEYASLLVLLLVSILWFRPYILRAFHGQWKKAGDTYGHGRQYDPRGWGGDGSGGGTYECFYEEIGGSGYWVPESCFEQNCNCMLDTADSNYQAQCTNCKINCAQNHPDKQYCQ
ncbi:MAG: hypothetical protein ACLFPX_07120 [Candidatus Omnitrophota bacterium]